MSGTRSTCFTVVALVALLAGCKPAALTPDEKAAVAELALSNLPALPPDPSNRHADDPVAAAFGATLFFDNGLSANGRVACVTCHMIDRQFQDDLPLANGIGRTNRRTMPLAGVAHNHFQFWDGRADSLWAQALVPLENPVEHGMTRLGLVHQVERRFRGRYENLFGALPALDHLPGEAGPKGDAEQAAAWSGMAEADRNAVNQVFSNLGKAIAAFERSIMHTETRFDRFAAALAEGREPDGDARLSDIEIEGLKLFVGKANCIDCHNGPRFTDDHFHNTGVPRRDDVPEDRGRATGAVEVAADPFNCLGSYSDANPDDCVALRFMKAEGPELERAYKTPSLRGVATRPPYMHAGQFATLEEVVEHYSTAPAAPAGRTEIVPVPLTDRGRAALVAFLRTLDD